MVEKVLEGDTSKLAALGSRHVPKGVAPEHYAVVGEALLMTLEQALPAGEFDNELKEEWAGAY